MERGSARRKQAARWWNAEARESAVAQGSERVATPRLTSESVRGPHSRGPHAAALRASHRPSLSLAVCACSRSRCADDRHATSAEHRDPSQSLHQSINWVACERSTSAEVLTRFVLTRTQRSSQPRSVVRTPPFRDTFSRMLALLMFDTTHERSSVSTEVG